MSEPTERALDPTIATALAALAARLDRLHDVQQAQSELIARLSARVDQLGDQASLLNGQGLLLSSRVDQASRDIYGARQIVMQAEHQLQQGLVSMTERLNEAIADIHRLHMIRESPEYKIKILRDDLLSLGQRLAQIERTYGQGQQ
ncbi:MAG: hypothetical protein IPP13_09545 [Kouleothrix sp.]|jgi:outer membrane murein-binding lipoprotein Lpp|nr:hypothetical protein [Kouleothrix sp.]